MKKPLLVSIALGIYTLTFSPWTAAVLPEPEEILKRVDEIRNPSQSYQMRIRSENSVFEVSLKGNDKTFVKTLEPARDRGRNLLMLGEEMWAYIPNLKRAVRVGLNQKLTGQAANGDISRMRWSGDYDATLENKTETEWTLLLTAKKKGLTYEKIRTWIEITSFRPLRAEFLTSQLKPLKKAVYSNYQVMAGQLRPTQITISDATRADEVSTLTIEKMDNREFPNSLFNQNNLQ